MTAENDALTAETVAETVQANWLFERLPAWVVDTLSAEQKEAIHKVIEDPSWKHPPVNIRFSIPIIHKRFYVTVVSGEEKRSVERRRRDRHSYPLRTAANVFFFIGIATLFYMTAVIVLAVQSAIIEF